MKSNKFLIVLALCIGFSSSITITSQTPPTSWTQSIKNRLSNWWNGATQQARNIRNYTVDTFKAIPQSVINRVGQWKVSTQQVLLGALVTSLVGLGIYNKDTILDYVGQLADQAMHNPGTAAAIGVAGTGAAIGGAGLLNDRRIMNAMDAQLSTSNYSPLSIDSAFEQALHDNTMDLLKSVIIYKYKNSNNKEIESNIKNALADNTYAHGSQAVNNLKREIELEILGKGKIKRKIFEN